MFAVTWAMATLFHVWVNPRSAHVLGAPGVEGIVHVALVLAAVWVLRVPGRLTPLLVLAALQVAAACVEAPFLGNHWLLAAFVALALLLAAAVRPADPAGTMRRFLPAARATLLVAYGFAAFSKLNEGFFTPATSCGTFYARELARSLGLPDLAATGASGWAAVLGTVAVECSLPVLLLVRRTRHAGVVLGLVFHSVIALDRLHLFTDFSAVLLALFLLFLPPSFAAAFGSFPVLRRIDRWGPPVGLLVSVPLWAAGGSGAPAGQMALGMAVWLTFDVAVVAVVIVHLRRHRPAPIPVLWLRPSGPRGAAPAGGRAVVPVAVTAGVPLFVPLLALMNGLTPYLELKTGFGWNMYSNLVTVGGHSNHLLVRRTWPLSDAQRHLVRVVDSGDPALRGYAEQRYRIPLPQLRAYAREHPRSWLRYELDGVLREARPIGADPVLARHVPLWRVKLQLFRAVDERDPPRCQDGWGPAR